MNQKTRFCQSCGMPLNDDVLIATEKDGSHNKDYCIYCYKDGAFTSECTMEDMIEHCAGFVQECGEKMTKEDFIGQMKLYFPKLKRWKNCLSIEHKEGTVNPWLADIEPTIAELCDNLPTTYIGSVDDEGFPYMKAMLSPRKREGIRTFYFTTNTFSLRVAQYRNNPKSCIYFCDENGFRTVMLRGKMEVLTDMASKEMIWQEGDTEYYPEGVTDPNYCVLRFTAIDGRFYKDYSPRSFIIGE